TATAFNETADNDNIPLTGLNSISVGAVAHNVVEDGTPVAGYTTTYSADCTNVSIANGATKTCTITNDDQPGTLIVKKLVVNDNEIGRASCRDRVKVEGGDGTAYNEKDEQHSH